MLKNDGGIVFTLEFQGKIMLKNPEGDGYVLLLSELDQELWAEGKDIKT